MKPIIDIYYEGTNSIIGMSLKGQHFKECIEKELTNKRYGKIVSSPVQLYFRLILEPEEKDLEQAYQQNGSVYVKATSEIDGDSEIYCLLLGLSRLQVPEGIQKILIIVSSNEVKEKPQSQTPDADERVGSIKYEAQIPLWTFDEIILTDIVRERLERATKIIKNRDIILQDLGYSRIDKTIKSVICFYGPAGTGKTITAQAIAKYLGKKIIISSYAQIESKYVGDGAKNLRKIFHDAEEQDAVLFMDECDSFLSKRIENTDSGSDKHYNRMSNELFQLLETHSGCIIFATNLLTDIDKAFKSRIVDSIYFPMPDIEGRIRILKKMCIPHILNSVFKSEDELTAFSEELEGFSGRDIRKSFLLTFAEVSDEIKTVGLDNYNWDLKKFRIGFDDVKKSFSEETDTNSIPLDEVQNFMDRKKFNQKQFELAKHAVLVDDGIDDREYQLLQDLSKQLMNVELKDRNVKTNLSLPDICDNIKEESQKRTLIDVAIRVASFDGSFSEKEKTFVEKLCKLMEYPDSVVEDFIKYGETLANAYSHWITAIERSETFLAIESK